MFVWLSPHSLKVFSHVVKWQNVVSYKCCYHCAGFRIISNVEVT
jgi:hypothetical protein